MKARETKLYTVDAESQTQKKETKRALIQIEFIYSINYSTVILFET
jgi:hypothetical protein